MVYAQLSQDPNSLANLDQDLPNYAQHQVPIHSLPQVQPSHHVASHQATNMHSSKCQPTPCPRCSRPKCAMGSIDLAKVCASPRPRSLPQA